MKLTRIKNLLPSKGGGSKREGSVSASSNSASPERNGSTRSWSVNKRNESPHSPPRKAKSTSKSRVVLPPRSPQNNNDTDSEPSLNGLSPEQKRRIFTQKLKNLSQTLLDDHAVASVTPSNSTPTMAAPESSSSPSPLSALRHHPSPAHTPTTAPSTTIMESVTAPTSPLRSRSGSSTNTPSTKKSKSVTTSTGTTASSGNPVATTLAAAVTPIMEVINKAKTPTPIISNPPKTKTAAPPLKAVKVTPKTATDDTSKDIPAPKKIAKVLTFGDQDAFTTIENTLTYESKTTYTMDTDSRWCDGTATDYGSALPHGFSTSFDMSGYPTYCTQTVDTATLEGDYTQYTDYCNQTQYTDCYTQVTNFTTATENTQLTTAKTPFWYNLLFSCTEPATAGEEQDSRRGKLKQIDEEEEEEEEEDRGPLNPCVAPTVVNKRRNAVGACVAPSDSGLGSLISQEEESFDKRSHRSHRGARFAVDDVRQTSFASSMSSSSSEDSSQTPSLPRRRNKLPSHIIPKEPAYGEFHHKKSLRNGHRHLSHHVDDSPFYLKNMPQRPLHHHQHQYPHVSRSPRSPRNGRVEFVKGDYAGRKGAETHQQQGHNNSGWLKQRLAGFRRKPTAAVQVPVVPRDDYLDYYDDYEEDNSTISTKFSLMAMRK